MKNVKTYEIKIEGKEWEKILDDTFNKIKKNIKLDGFRKGAVSKEIYIKKFGIEALYPDAIDVALPVAFEKCLKDNNVTPVAEPKADVKAIDSKSVTFEFTIITKPEVKLGKYID